MALSRGPSVERMVNRHLTSAGSPHRTALAVSRWAGQSRNIIVASVGFSGSLMYGQEKTRGSRSRQHLPKGVSLVRPGHRRRLAGSYEAWCRPGRVRGVRRRQVSRSGSRGCTAELSSLVGRDLEIAAVRRVSGCSRPGGHADRSRRVSKSGYRPAGRTRRSPPTVSRTVPALRRLASLTDARAGSTSVAEALGVPERCRETDGGHRAGPRQPRAADRTRQLRARPGTGPPGGGHAGRAVSPGPHHDHQQGAPGRARRIRFPGAAAGPAQDGSVGAVAASEAGPCS